MIRILDLALATVALVLLAPILVPTALILAVTGEGEVFYKQVRVGKGGVKFSLLKFATMLRNSPSIGTGSITVRDDPRVLPVGKFLRKTKINELPQLINILRGEMSLIGPRPLTDDTFSFYSETQKQLIKSVLPGLSGVGSIVFRDEESLMQKVGNPREFYANKISPYKGELELWYVRNRSLSTYIKCILLTIWVVIRPRSALPRRVLQGLPPAPAELSVL